MQLMNAIHDGLQASDPTLSSPCANTIDHLASFYFTNQAKDKVSIAKLKQVSMLWFMLPVFFPFHL
jgi:exportin-7